HFYPPVCTVLGGFGLRRVDTTPLEASLVLPNHPDLQLGNPDGTTWGCPPPSHTHIIERPFTGNEERLYAQAWSLVFRGVLHKWHELLRPTIACLIRQK